jgi:VIT1/CCC1 family predicted Fe2+/Mn2+ transporter
VLLGFTDGVLTALVLASGTISGSVHGWPGVLLAIKVGVFAFTSGFFVYFVSRFFELRHKLLEVGRQLSVTDRRALLSTSLGRTATLDSAIGAVTASCCSFLGGAFPLTIAALVPEIGAMGLLTALAILGIMGLALGRMTMGSPLVWAAGMVVGGGVVAAIGAQLRLLSG